ncbi:protein terminal ear1 homolog [Cryptomeria japonica]|uniref:protein terminal ear1 homolog n=1 Tax=Cryptomeria japonica TaxID=3369 RepID=UPI0027DA6154|nr:protein terminal ear1 homolog [Cryptomeria japonica]
MKSHQAQGFLFKGDMKKDNAQESSQFVFEEEVAKRNSSSARTTLMIKNIPNVYRIKRNLGYAFVNFTSAKATWKLYKEFHMQPWKCLDSKRTSLKICEIIYAKVQGRAALESHFKKYNFRGVYAKYSLLVFDPPRNGKESRESSMSSQRRGRLLYV